MNPRVLTILFNMLVVLGGLFALYGMYYVVLALIGLKKRPEFETTTANTRFAVLIAARNEEAVIGQLVESLHGQNYPKHLYDVIVAPNNCTDNTRGVALEHGAQVFDAEGTIRSKGDVLHQLVAKLMAEGQYDAICVFDADNLVHPDFLQKMNNARAAGALAAQGFRDSKNPEESAISTCYSVCYWMLNRFYNAGREAMGLSSLIHGCGFMVTMEMLDKLGGWNTTTMTEDYEYSAQIVLANERVRYVPGAIFYDEQPITFNQSWKQRRRWSSGNVQGMEGYLPALLNHAVTCRSGAALDVAMTFMLPLIQLASLSVGIATLGVFAYRVIEFHFMSIAQAVLVLGMGALASFLLCILLAAFVVLLNRGGRKMYGTIKGIVYFAFFLISWTPIAIISIFKKKKTWDPIIHTNRARLHDMNTTE